MILMVSGRTDIIAFYSEWFINRYEEGFVDVRNPFNPQLVNRINFMDVDAIMFCTKNPWPIIDYLPKINKPILFHTTITPYHKDIEPNVISKTKIIEGVIKISEIIGSENTVVRYDPIFINKTYTVQYHLKAFERLCSLLSGVVSTIIISFLDDYKNVRKNRKIINEIAFTNDDYKRIGEGFSSIAKQYQIKVQTCHEDINLVEYGFSSGECLSKEIAYKLTGKIYPKWKARACNCVEMVDIGAYNTCKHFCAYCYANYDEKAVSKNVSLHQPTASLLVGVLANEEVVKNRK